MEKKSINEWSVQDVEEWASALGLGETVIQSLTESEIDGMTLMEVTEDDLKSIGITVLGQYKKILRERDALLNKGSSSLSGALLSWSRSGNMAMEDEGDFIDAADLELVKKLGGGHFGEVWLAMWEKRTKVAVKWLKGANTDEEFLKEIHLMKKIKHPNIIHYYGLSPDPATSVMRLVTELMEDGSLLDWLRKSSLDHSDQCRVRICMDITAGLIVSRVFVLFFFGPL